LATPKATAIELDQLGADCWNVDEVARPTGSHGQISPSKSGSWSHPVVSPQMVCTKLLDSPGR